MFKRHAVIYAVAIVTALVLGGTAAASRQGQGSSVRSQVSTAKHHHDPMAMKAKPAKKGHHAETRATSSASVSSEEDPSNSYGDGSSEDRCDSGYRSDEGSGDDDSYADDDSEQECSHQGSDSDEGEHQDGGDNQDENGDHGDGDHQDGGSNSGGGD